MGWYYYIEGQLVFPFQAKTRSKRGPSILRPGEVVSVVGMADEEECEREIFVTVETAQHCFDAPLEQLEPINADEATSTAVATWHYWRDRGYSYG